MTRGVSVQGSLYPGEFLSGDGGSLSRGSLSGGVSVRGSLSGVSVQGVYLQSRSLSRAGLCPEVGGVSLRRPLPESEKWAVRILLECFFVI